MIFVRRLFVASLCLVLLACEAGDDVMDAVTDSVDASTGPDAAIPMSPIDMGAHPVFSDGMVVPDDAQVQPEADAAQPIEGCVPAPDYWESTAKSVIEGSCGACHGESPQFGAYGHLTNYDSLMELVPGREDGVRWADRLAARLGEGTMPPAGYPQPGTELRMAIADWATCGDWSTNNATAPNPGGFDSNRPILRDDGVVPIGTDFFDLRADEFHVTAEMGDRYECFHFELPIDEERFIRRVETVVDDARVLHHAILLPQAEGEPGTHGGCDDDNPLSLVYGWAPGQGALSFSEGGIRIRPGQRMTLQIHYNNGAAHPDVFDSSGVRIFHGPTDGPEVSMLTFGPLGFSVPPMENKEVSGWCRLPSDMTLLYSFPHMHEVGVGFEQVIERSDPEEDVNVIEIDGWDFGSQFIYETPLELKIGDIVRTSCTYENSEDRTVRFGPNTGDEMCFNFAYVTPPPPISFCNQNEPPIPLVYEPGECAAANTPGESVLPVFASFIEGEPPQLLGDEFQEGQWVIDEAEIYIESFEFGAFALDTEQSSVLAMGTLVHQEGLFHLDAQTEINLVAGGVSFSAGYPISFSARPMLTEDMPGRLNPDVTCGDLPGGRNVRFSSEDGSLRIMVPARIGPVSVKFLVSFTPVVSE